MERPSNPIVDAAGKKPQRKLRSACDSCHQTKVRCSRGNPCQTCANLDHECVYSVSNRIGRPRGTKNKRTIERMNREKALAEASKLEAERAQTFQNYAGHILNVSAPAFAPVPVTSPVELQQQCPPAGVAGILLPEMMGNVAQHFEQYSMPMTAPPALGMVDQRWSQVSNEQTVNWLHEQIPMHQAFANNTHPAPPPHGMLASCDMPHAGTVEEIQQPFWIATTSPQSHYLTPTSSIRGTEARTSPEYQQPVASGEVHEQLRQISTPESSTEEGSVSRRSSVIAGPGTRQRGMTESSVTSFASCDCLQAQTDVLLRSKRLGADPSAGINGLLDFAKQAVNAWRSILQCDTCRNSGSERETWMLCVMSVRNFVRSLQNLDVHVGCTEQARGQVTPEYGSPVSLLRGSSFDNTPYGDLAMSRVASTQSHSADIDMDSWARQAIINKVLLCRALAQTKEILVALRQVLESWRNQSENEAGPDEQRNPWQMQQMQQQLQQQQYGQQFAGFAMSDNAAAASQSVGVERQGWSDDSQVEDGDDAVHLLSQVKCLEMAVYGLSQRLKDWALA